MTDEQREPLPDTLERQQLLDRYLNDAPFHHLVDRVAYNAAHAAKADGPDEYRVAVRAAKEAILRWLEQTAHNAAIQRFIDNAADRRRYNLGPRG